MYRVFVIHFQPLEYFPPALNFVRYLASREDILVSVSTTQTASQSFRAELDDRVDLRRFDLLDYRTATRIGRALKYIKFAFSTILQIRQSSPDVIVYVDPYSALPGIVYKLLLSRNVKLWIHFSRVFFTPVVCGWNANGESGSFSGAEICF